MKLSKLAAALATVALFFAGVAVSAEANKMTIHIDQKVTVNGKVLDNGKYIAEWNGEGPNVQVTLLHGKDAVATFPAQIKQEASANSNDAIGTTDGPDGSKQLTAIYPSGKRMSIQLDNSGAGSSGSAASR
jgi:ABC-type glycerol-3-phosphate transport system substrate-binding protein